MLADFRDPEPTLSLIHTFAGNPLDRADTSRRDPAWLASATVDPASRYLPFWQLNVLLDPAGRLGWLATPDIVRLDIDVPPVFLGCRDGVAHFAIDISELGDPQHELNLDEGARFEDCRRAAMHLDTPATGIVAQSRAQIDWHRRHRFCSMCGARTEQDRGGHVRRCGECRAEHFPRTDPVAIMLVDRRRTRLLPARAGGGTARRLGHVLRARRLHRSGRIHRRGRAPGSPRGSRHQRRRGVLTTPRNPGRSPPR
jgi:hypothetical protein